MDEKSLLYAQSHEWAKIDGADCTIGITRYAVEQLTDIVYVELPEVGRTLTRGETFGVIESVKAVSDLYAPVAGEVVAINDALLADTALITQDPYELGWLIKLRLGDSPDTAGLMDWNGYQQITH